MASFPRQDLQAGRGQGRNLTGMLIADLMLQLLSYVAQASRQAAGKATGITHKTFLKQERSNVPEKTDA
ncbi:MAG: hypothetical protein IJ438_04200 [Clostridia bacterium]|nr:hypothetical protein [Clostridia bacterium]